MRHANCDSSRKISARITILVTIAVCTVGGCHRDMKDQSRYEAYEASPFFVNGQASRQPLEGTIAREQRLEDSRSTGKADGQFVTEFPVDIDRAVLERGRDRYRIYCALCHGEVGIGDGMIVRRGFKPPPSYHQARLREVPPGYLFDVVSHGFGVMPRFGDRLEPEDRWAIVAYVRVLQLSQQGQLDDVPGEVRQKLESAE